MTLGFIGCGNMALAMIGGIIKNGLAKPEDILASALHEEKLKQTEKTLGIQTTLDNRLVTIKADVLFLAVKPQFYPSVIAQIKDVVRKDQVIVSIAPGKTLAWLTEQFGKPVKLIRCMPNTPALVGEGITGSDTGRSMHRGRYKKGAGPSGRIWKSRSGSGASDGCRGRCQRQFPSLCICIY